MKRNHHVFSHFLLLSLTFLLCSLSFSGCSKKEAPEKTDALDFTIVAGTDIPGDLQELIQNRQENPFELTYTDNTYLYVVKGYGKQDNSGYNIVVNDFYQAEDCLVFDSELFGPKTNEEVSGQPSYPYIVIKTEYREEPVIFL